MSVITAELLLPASCAQSALEEKQMLETLTAVGHRVWGIGIFTHYNASLEAASVFQAAYIVAVEEKLSLKMGSGSCNPLSAVLLHGHSSTAHCGLLAHPQGRENLTVILHGVS